MGKFDKTIYVIVVVFALLVLSGFYFIFDKIGNLRTDLKNSELSSQILEKRVSDFETANQNPAGNNQEIPSNPPPANILPKNDAVVINTAILFETQSNPALQPQTKITVLVEKVAKSGDGTVTLSFRTFTNDASTYSTIEPRDFFEIVNLNGENQRPLEVKGQFTSIPPKSATAGEIVFKTETMQNTLILQIGGGENIKFYEFNFSKKTYKETVLG